MSIATAYETFCTTHFSLPSEADVEDLEHRIGASLPSDYRHYLLKYNGGDFSSPRIIPSADIGEECPSAWLDSMYGLGAEHETAEIARSRDLAIFDDNDPLQILPIGNTLSNYLILLLTYPEESGTILLKTFDDSFWLADGIEEFFESLVPPE